MICFWLEILVANFEKQIEPSILEKLLDCAILFYFVFFTFCPNFHAVRENLISTQFQVFFFTFCPISTQFEKNVFEVSIFVRLVQNIYISTVYNADKN